MKIRNYVTIACTQVFIVIIIEEMLCDYVKVDVLFEKDVLKNMKLGIH